MMLFLLPIKMDSMLSSLAVRSWLAYSATAHEQTRDEEHDKNDKQNPRDLRRGAGYSSES
jgi:hypothetical protein